MFSYNPVRRVRPVAIVGLVLLSLTLYLSYQRMDSTTFAFFQDSFAADDQKALTGQDSSNRTSFFADLPSMSYGTASRPFMKGLPEKLIDTLPQKYVPAVVTTDKSPEEGRGARRLVIVGDVHGQKKALKDLLAKLDFKNEMGDHLVFTGDLVNKGPDSAGVVALAMELGAHSVRGNHEDRVLLTHAAMNAHTSKTASEGSVDLATKVLEKSQVGGGEQEEIKDLIAAKEEYLAGEAALSKGDRIDRETAKSLSPEQIKWLSELPLILRIGAVPVGSDSPTFQDLVVCHAGLVPNVALEDQDPWAVMNMRTIVYPIDELRRDAVKTHLKEKAERNSKSGNRGILAALQAIDGATVDRELQKILKSEGVVNDQGKTDHTKDVGLPSSGREGTYWYEEWSRFQEELAKQEKKAEKKAEKKQKKKQLESRVEEEVEGEDEDADTMKKHTPPRTTVVYGHDAKSGLQVPDIYGKGKRGYTFGLDSGCVYGKQLSAMVIEISGDQVLHTIVQVPCKKAVDPKD